MCMHLDFRISGSRFQTPYYTTEYVLGTEMVSYFAV